MRKELLERVTANRRRFGALVLAPLLLAATSAAHAVEISTYTYLGGTHAQLVQTALTELNTSQWDSNNFAIARVDATTGSVGIAASTSGSASIAAIAGLTENWGCDCVNMPPLEPITVLSVNVDGTLRPDLPGDGFGGVLFIMGYTFRFDWTGSTMTGQFCSPTFLGPSCSPVNIAMTSQADGSLRFNETLQMQLKLGLSPTFGTGIYLNANFDPTGGPISLDFLNTFRFDIVSGDPNTVWTSDSGRTTIAAASNSVPEPGSMSLVLAGLGSVGALICRRRDVRPRRRPSGYMFV